MQTTSPARGSAAPASQSASPSPYLLWAIWIFWLFFLAQPLDEILAVRSPTHKALDLAGLALFIGVYLWATWQEAWRLTRDTPTPSADAWKTWTPIVVLLVLGVLMIFAQGQSALGSMIYVTASMCGRLTARAAAAAIAGILLLIVLLGAITGVPPSVYGQILFIVPAVGSFVFFFARAIRTNQELRRARQEIARLAVSEERLRFARDLHDLLGHTLSLIALKSELARRLVSVSPGQASSEIGDIETAARQALFEVREAVAGYRQPTLDSELRSARELLAAAGIALTQRGEPPALAPAVEATLSWAVREAVTNVIRHSHARSCSISFARQDDRVALEVRDDGVGGAGADGEAGGPHGNGLAGLRERVSAQGGTCEAGMAEGGGFRLAVSLPTDTAPGGAGALVGGEPEAGETHGTERRVTAWFG